LSVSEQNAIRLTFDERQKMNNTGECPNCHKKEFVLKAHPTPNHPLFPSRPIYQCVSCEWWTDWFDGYVWHPKEDLNNE